MKATILIGISGSGKSTIAKTIPGKICSADKYFLNSAGEYQFDYKKLGRAHACCMRSFIDALSCGDDAICDNTNTTIAEVAPYLSVAAAFGADVDVVIVDCDVTTAHARNVHGVLLTGIEGQFDRMVRLINDWPSFWPKGRRQTNGNGHKCDPASTRCYCQ